MKLADAWPLAKETVVQFLHDKGPRLGAALAFYIALSLSPLLLVVVAVAGAVFGEQAARGELAHQIQDQVGPDGAKAIETMLASHKSHGQGILMTVIGVVTLVIGASGVFAQLQDALDTIWEVNPRQSGGGIWRTIKDRLLSFSIVLGMAFLLLVSLVLSAVLSAMGGWLENQLPLQGWGLRVANHGLTFALTAVLFALIFKVLPHARPPWSDVWVGAVITALLFTIGKYLIGLYLGQAAVGSAYGAAGSFVVLLVWIYYSAQILLLGAEFTRVYAKRYGSTMPPEPSPGPERISPHSATAAAH